MRGRRYRRPMLIRPVTPAEHDELGRITLDAYRGIPLTQASKTKRVMPKK